MVGNLTRGMRQSGVGGDCRAADLGRLLYVGLLLPVAGDEVDMSAGPR